MLSKARKIGVALSLFLVLVFAACASEKPAAELVKVSGARSGVFSVDRIIRTVRGSDTVRRAALMGVYVSSYLAESAHATSVLGGLEGVGVQSQMMILQNTIRDPDFDLIQAFADALQVDVADLLNRSVNREETLGTYTEALTNVATRSNERYKELVQLLEQVREAARVENKERSAADRDLKEALRKKDFSNAGELQKLVNEKQAAFAETDLQRKQLEDIVETFSAFLTLYGQKILAIEKNREPLIAGTKVIDIPGAEEIRVLERERARRRAGRGNSFDDLFTDQLEGL